jgi:hypothetical protein
MDVGWQGRRSCGDGNRVHVNSRACMAAESMRYQMAETTVAALSYSFVIYLKKRRQKQNKRQVGQKAFHSTLNTFIDIIYHYELINTTNSKL